MIASKFKWLGRTIGVMGALLVAPTLLASINTTLLREFVIENNALTHVIFDARSQRIVLCKQAELEKCKTLSTSAVDVLPMQSRPNDNSAISLLLTFADGSHQVCKIGKDNNIADCANQSAVEVLRANARQRNSDSLANGFKFTHTEGEFTCGFKDGRSVGCSVVTEITKKRSTLYAGRFSQPDTLELISVREGSVELCQMRDSGTACDTLQVEMDLGAFRSAKSASAKSLSDGRFALFLVHQNKVEVCTVNVVAPPNRISLGCRVSAISPASKNVRAFLVPDRANDPLFSLQFVSANRKVSPQQGREVAYFNAAGDRQILNPRRILDEATNEDSLNGGNQSIEAGLGEAHRIIKQPLEASRPTFYNPDDEFDDVYSGPFLMQIWENDLLVWETWSDLWGITFPNWDIWANAVSRPQCLANCETELADNQGHCAHIAAVAGGVGLAFTIGATVGAAITGPGALAVLSTGVAATASVTGLVGAGCVAWAYEQRSRCIRRC